MAIRLTITDRRAPESEHFRGFVQSKVVFGRARICDVCLPDLSVSAIHAELRLENNVYSIIDLSSLNGTAVEGRRLIAHRPRRLQHGDVVVWGGGDRMRFHGVLSIKPGRHELLGEQRINLTFRKVR